MLRQRRRNRRALIADRHMPPFGRTPACNRMAISDDVRFSSTPDPPDQCLDIRYVAFLRRSNDAIGQGFLIRVGHDLPFGPKPIKYLLQDAQLFRRKRASRATKCKELLHLACPKCDES